MINIHTQGECNELEVSYLSLCKLHKIRFTHSKIFNNRWNVNLHTQGDSGKMSRDQLKADHLKKMEEEVV